MAYIEWLMRLGPRLGAPLNRYSARKPNQHRPHAFLCGPLSGKVGLLIFMDGEP